MLGEDLTTADAGAAPDSASLLDLLALERIEPHLYRANVTIDEPFPLYGGQVAAQALRAAGHTVDADRLPHSLHGYFLRPGNASQPTLFRVECDRDGRSFSARRVVALQQGKVIFNMSASFHVREQGPDAQVPAMPAVTAPEHSRPYQLGRLQSFENRVVEQPYPDTSFPVRFWSRCTEAPGEDELLHTCVLAYLSDISSGVVPFNDATHHSSASLDHAVWFHRPVTTDDWVLMDLVPRSISNGRGWYTGSLFQRGGSLVASLAQENLFRARKS